LYNLRYVFLSVYLAIMLGGGAWCIWAGMELVRRRAVVLILLGLQAFFLVGCPEMRLAPANQTRLGNVIAS